MIWSKPCLNAFRKIADTNPVALIKWINEGNLEPAHLTFAAETLGSDISSNIIIPTLVSLLYHKDPIVREGAIYGASYHLHDENIVSALKNIESNDASTTIREIAREALID